MDEISQKAMELLQDDSDDEVEGGGRLPRNNREELQRRADALENWEQDPNSSVLLDPAAVGVSERRRPGWMRLLELARRGRHDSG